jgi:polysaccharide biosynthesis protein PelA
VILAFVLAMLAADEKREVLCLFDSSESRSAQICETHLYAETVLNHLGLIPVYWDVNQPLPDDAAMARYRGVLTWFVDTRMKKSLAYWKWIGRQPAAGRKVVILGNLGATYEVPSEFINEGLRPLGLTYHGHETENASVIEIVKKDPIVEFERTLDQELHWYVHITSDPSNEVLLRARRTDVPGSESDLVTLGPNGGFAWVVIHYDPRVDRDQWRLDPFTFLARAFDVQQMPKLDFTTAMGRRIFFASIDGDGIGNGAQPGPHVGKLAGEIVRDEFLKKIDLPVTASVIAADLEEHSALAKSIFELPNVEVGAHGWFHPINWHKKTLSYVGEFSLEREITLAVRRIEEVSAPKKVKVYLWTGDCDPPSEAVALTEQLGLPNLNGSDPGRTQNYESLANLRSPTIWNGGHLQFNGRSMSENHFTDLWSRNFFAFRHAIVTYERTGAPRRITPIHVYFHFYVVEQPGGERALREIYDWIRSQKIHPMTVSEYDSWIRGFLSGHVEKLDDGGWRIRDYGACRTIRFDNTTENVDLTRSSNVLGYSHEGSTLYVHLWKGPEATIRLGGDGSGTYLMDSNGDWEWEEGVIRARAPAEATFMTLSGPVHKSARGHDLKVELK